MNYIIQGLILGLILSYLPGPIFWGLIQVGIERGFRAALAYASGIWICDVFFVFATYFGVSYFIALTQIEGFNYYLAFIGGGILIASGLGTLLTKPQQFAENQTSVSDNASRLGIFLRGFFFNLFNPGTVFFWLGISSQLSAYQPSGTQALWFFSGMWMGLVSSDLLKAYLAKQIKNRMTARVLWIIKVIISLILVGSGVFIIIKVFWQN